MSSRPRITSSISAPRAGMGRRDRRHRHAGAGRCLPRVLHGRVPQTTPWSVMETVGLRPRSATEIVDATFRLSRATYPVLVTVTGVIVAPALLLKLILPFDASGLGEVFARLLFAVSDGAVISVASGAYLGGAADAGTGLRAVRGRVARLIFASLARNILIAIGLLLLI